MTPMSASMLVPAETSVRRTLGLLFVPQHDEPFATSDRRPAIERNSLQLPDTKADRALLRWLLGHQIAYCVWRRLAGVLWRMAREGTTDKDLAEAASWYHRYTALFIYAGSCGENLYSAIIRPSMAHAHPGFSGVWARDYTRVSRLLHELAIPPGSSLKQAVKTNRTVHMRIAKILVPEGESLLKASGQRAGQGALPEQEDLFDKYFLVERTAVTENSFAFQAVFRAKTALLDLEQHPIQRAEYASVLTMLPDDITTVFRDMVLAFTPLRTGVPR
ncbi:hypothetical protein [Lentzea sp. E54]|uniref:hypothetical protein n=1 Tax=Lentzea xerophila TaxID=3435883 RepID=UPI003DA39A1F